MRRSSGIPALALLAALGGSWAGTSPAHATDGRSAASSTYAQAAAAVPAAAAAQSIPLRVEPLGDSLTYGSHSSTGNGYRGPLWNELTGEGYRLDFVGSVREGTMADPETEGHPGWRIDAIQGLAATVTTNRPNVVTLMAGTNDLVQNHDVASAPARLSTLIDTVLSDDPGVTVVVANLITSTDADVAAAVPAYNKAVAALVQSKQAAGKHVGFADMSAVTTSDLADPYHPGDPGYQKMADAWNKGIQAAAAAGWIAPPASVGAPAAGATGQIGSGVSGKCLDVAAGSSADGTAVQLWDCNHSGAQTWTVYSDGTLRALGKCLDATGGATANGTKAQLYSCNGTGGQVWQGYSGGFVNLASGRCLDDPNTSTTNGTQVALWDCNSGANQQWAPPGVGPVTSSVAGKCLDDNADSNVNGTKADLWDCNSTAAQQWVVHNGVVQASGMCLDVVGAGTANGTLVDLWDCSGTPNQTWQPGANSTLVNPASGKCLDDPNTSTANGTQLEIWDCHGGANQQWALSGR
ncbi:ricin-type beta-trefoil lectin domain protein [Streptomyces sp. V4-01]|uniref:Ricin-type beta-trefoil lectin domain protein n=1 Tax=Actinacidiphila polyblastidii TaxID=3110430 RepID=A0ABU7PBB0_9ACTN|nr:ricin-type beta-trefoil lectin domain protein [Streptomyces sp. V4-01]